MPRPTCQLNLTLDVPTAEYVEEIAYADLNVSYIQLLASLMGQIIVSHARPELARAWAY